MHRWVFDPRSLTTWTPAWGTACSPVTAPERDGSTTFTFVTSGVQGALAQARAAAGERDVAVAGGLSTVRQFLAGGCSTSCAS